MINKSLIIIPTYNESENIELIINKIINVDNSNDILVVDDNSPDGTFNIVENLKDIHDKRVFLIKREKKSNITPDNINILFLCQIPSVSTTSAKAIMEHFGTMYNLTNALLENKECLKDMTYMCGKKERKISKKVIENITNYLCK